MPFNFKNSRNYFISVFSFVKHLFTNQILLNVIIEKNSVLL